MKTCAIETSCDESAVSILIDDVVSSSIIASQIKWHRQFGGVVPELASRMHAEKIHTCIEQAFKDANLAFDDIDQLAVTYGPGLEGALLVGISAAKAMAATLNVPLYPINHLHGHIYSAFLSSEKPRFPFICLLISGGHTLLILVKDHFKFELLGSTRDDACGEAFDKAARAMGLSYPGGPVIEKLALDGDDSRYHFPRAMKSVPYEFSFSGLKTAVAQTCMKLGDDLVAEVPHLSASFQRAVADTLIEKSFDACRDQGVEQLVICGGVMANKMIASEFDKASQRFGISVLLPPPEYCTDHAAMIACAAHYYHEVLGSPPRHFYVNSQLKVDSL